MMRRHGRGARAARRRMIIGIGSDLCDIRRIEKTLERFGERFTRRCFTEIEREKSDRAGAARGVLRQAIRRQGGLRQGARHRARRAACWSRTWASSTCRRAPDVVLTGAAAARLAAMCARLAPPGASPNPPDHHRRISAGAGAGADRGVGKRAAAHTTACLSPPKTRNTRRQQRSNASRAMTRRDRRRTT